MNKMQVVTYAATSHVLGALRSNAGSALTIDDVAAHGLLIRDSDGAGVQTRFDIEKLQLVEMDYDTRVFYHPQSFIVVEGRAEQREKPASAVLNGTKVTVTLPSSTPGVILASVHVSGDPLTEPAVCAVTIPKNETSASAELTLATGQYQVALFVPGYAMTLTLATVS
jgi:hypothetical protein